MRRWYITVCLIQHKGLVVFSHDAGRNGHIFELLVESRMRHSGHLVLVPDSAVGKFIEALDFNEAYEHLILWESKK